MTCQEALRLLYEVIDKEADQIDTEKVREHLENCRDCMKRFEFETMFKTFVTERAASPTRTDQLKYRILARLEEGEPEKGGFFTNFFKNRNLIFAAAAILVIFLVSALSLSQLYRHRTYVYPFEKHHLEGNPSSATESNSGIPLTQIKDYLASELHLALSESVEGYQMLHCGFDDIIGHKYVHVRYRNGSARVSLFFGRSADTILPNFQRAFFAGTEYYRHVCADCQMIYWKHGNSIAMAVSEDKTIDLPAFIATVQPI
jgi:mycothiol system anti-sigma-R factor